MKTYQLSVKLWGRLEIEAESADAAKELAQDWRLDDVEEFSLEIYDIFCEEDYETEEDL